jgi:hypothetical protein
VHPSNVRTWRWLLQVRRAGELIESADSPRTFVQSARLAPCAGILPCIDAAVLDMKLGERAMIYSPSRWAYGSPDYKAADGTPPLPPGATEMDIEVRLTLTVTSSLEWPPRCNKLPVARRHTLCICLVVHQVELELVDFTKAKEKFEMTGEENLQVQGQLKARGNELFARGTSAPIINHYPLFSVH